MRVLFVCFGNACRSQMADAIARQDAADVMTVHSAGLLPLGYVPEMTTRTLEENGYPAEGLRSKGISRDVWEAADLVINMSGEAREQAFPEFVKVEDWEVEDPFGENPEVYQRICEEIQGRVAKLATRIREEELKRGSTEKIKI
jgi:arsenate reductase (thioredoxin)